MLTVDLISKTLYGFPSGRHIRFSSSQRNTWGVIDPLYYRKPSLDYKEAKQLIGVIENLKKHSKQSRENVINNIDKLIINSGLFDPDTQEILARYLILDEKMEEISRSLQTNTVYISTCIYDSLTHLIDKKANILTQIQQNHSFTSRNGILSKLFKKYYLDLGSIELLNKNGGYPNIELALAEVMSKLYFKADSSQNIKELCKISDREWTILFDKALSELLKQDLIKKIPKTKQTSVNQNKCLLESILNKTRDNKNNKLKQELLKIIKEELSNSSDLESASIFLQRYENIIPKDAIKSTEGSGFNYIDYKINNCYEWLLEREPIQNFIASYISTPEGKSVFTKQIIRNSLQEVAINLLFNHYSINQLHKAIENKIPSLTSESQEIYYHYFLLHKRTVEIASRFNISTAHLMHEKMSKLFEEFLQDPEVKENLEKNYPFLKNEPKSENAISLKAKIRNIHFSNPRDKVEARLIKNLNQAFLTLDKLYMDLPEIMKQYFRNPSDIMSLSQQFKQSRCVLDRKINQGLNQLIHDKNFNYLLQQIPDVQFHKRGYNRIHDTELAFLKGLISVLQESKKRCELSPELKKLEETITECALRHKTFKVNQLKEVIDPIDIFTAYLTENIPLGQYAKNKNASPDKILALYNYLLEEMLLSPKIVKLLENKKNVLLSIKNIKGKNKTEYLKVFLSYYLPIDPENLTAKSDKQLKQAIDSAFEMLGHEKPLYQKLLYEQIINHRTAAEIVKLSSEIGQTSPKYISELSSKALSQLESYLYSAIENQTF